MTQRPPCAVVRLPMPRRDFIKALPDAVRVEEMVVDHDDRVVSYTLRVIQRRIIAFDGEFLGVVLDMEAARADLRSGLNMKRMLDSKGSSEEEPWPRSPIS